MDDKQKETFPWEEKLVWGLCSPSSMALLAVLDSNGVGRKGRGWSRAAAGLHRISSEDFHAAWLGGVAPASPRSSSATCDFS